MNPSVDRDVINLDPTFGQQFFDVSVGQSISQVPADRQQDDIRRKPEASEPGPINRRRYKRATAHTDSLADLSPDARTQQCRLDKAVKRLGPDPQPAALHRVRILTKGTRYSAEAVASAFGPRSGRFAKSLAKVQDSLGEHNDAIVAERWLAANAAELEPTSAFAAGRLAQLLHAETNIDLQGWKEPYQTAARKRNRSWFAQVR